MVCVQATALSPAVIPGAMAADNLAMAAYLAAVMAVPVASRQMSSSLKSTAGASIKSSAGASIKSSAAAAEAQRAASAVAGSEMSAPSAQQQDVAFTSTLAGPSRAQAALLAAGYGSSNVVPAEALHSSGVTTAVAEPVSVAAAAAAASQTSSSDSVTAEQRDEASLLHDDEQHSRAEQQEQSAHGNTASSSSADGSASTSTTERLAMSVAAGCIACAMGHSIAGILGSSSLSLMIMALLASAIGSVAAVMRPTEPPFAGR
jgi:hypothetical protein